MDGQTLQPNVDISTRRPPPQLGLLGIDLIHIPAGQFVMGSQVGADWADATGPDAHLLRRETPQRPVELAAYFVSRYPVTVAQYATFVESTGRRPLPAPGTASSTARDEGRLPVSFVPWHDAHAFCRWLTRETGLQFHLPTEAQWEKAARGTDGRTYPWGEESPVVSVARDPAASPGEFHSAYVWGESIPETRTRFCHCAAPEGGPCEVGQHPDGASPWGCMDMAGNVWEWCADWFDPDYYKIAPAIDPRGPEKGISKVVRGGAYDSPPRDLRCAARYYDRPDRMPFFACGFRIATRLERTA